MPFFDRKAKAGAGADANGNSALYEKSAASDKAQQQAPRDAGTAEAQQNAVYVADVDGDTRGGAGAFLKGGVERHLSLFDKKAALINA